MIGWVAIESEDVVIAAFAEPSNSTVANVVGPSLNTTLPVGVPAPGAAADTDAVIVTGWPNTDGDPDDATLVTVAALPTTWESNGDVLAMNPTAPP